MSYMSSRTRTRYSGMPAAAYWALLSRRSSLIRGGGGHLDHEERVLSGRLPSRVIETPIDDDVRAAEREPGDSPEHKVHFSLRHASSGPAGKRADSSAKESRRATRLCCGVGDSHLMTCPWTISIARETSSARSRYSASVRDSGSSSSHHGLFMGIILARSSPGDLRSRAAQVSWSRRVHADGGLSSRGSHSSGCSPPNPAWKPGSQGKRAFASDQTTCRYGGRTMP